MYCAAVNSRRRSYSRNLPSRNEFCDLPQRVVMLKEFSVDTLRTMMLAPTIFLCWVLLLSTKVMPGACGSRLALMVLHVFRVGHEGFFVFCRRNNMLA